MSDFTDWGENEICRIVTSSGSPLPPAFEIALLESVSDSAFVEVSYAGYSRQSAPRNLTTWCGTQGAGSETESSGTSRTISNNVTFDFGTAGGDATATAVGLFYGSELFCYARMNAPMAINSGGNVQIPPGFVLLTFSNVGGMSNFLANKMHDFLYRGQPFAFPSQYSIALYVRVPDEMGAGGIEASGAGYARATVSQWGQPENGTIKSAELVQFQRPVSTWGTIQGDGLLDSAGNIYFTQQYSEPKSISAGAGAPYFPEGYIGIRVQ